MESFIIRAANTLIFSKEDPEFICEVLKSIPQWILLTRLKNYMREKEAIANTLGVPLEVRYYHFKLGHDV